MNSCHGAGGSFDFSREYSRLSLRMLKFNSLMFCCSDQYPPLVSRIYSPLEPIDLRHKFALGKRTTSSIVSKKAKKLKHKHFKMSRKKTSEEVSFLFCCYFRFDTGVFQSGVDTLFEAFLNFRFFRRFNVEFLFIDKD